MNPPATNTFARAECAMLESSAGKPSPAPRVASPSLARTRSRPGEAWVEGAVRWTAYSTIVAVLLILVFVAREAWPLIRGRDAAVRIAAAQIRTVEQAEALGAAQLAPFLGMKESELSDYDAATRRSLIELKIEEVAGKDHPDALLDPASWGMMWKPHAWGGYDRPEYIWQPVGEFPKFNMVPLVLGSLKAALVAMWVAIPLSLGAAIYVSLVASPRWSQVLKPAIELLAGIPSVVLGVFALLVLAGPMQALTGAATRLNALVAGVALGLAVIPVIFTLAEEALAAVPDTYKQGALALGASPWQAACHIVLPAAIPGIFAACLLGFGRAIGETMIVLLASGNASVMSASIFDSCRTMTATIAAELAEVVFGGDHYRVLFLMGTLLFAFTFCINVAGEWMVRRLRRRLEGRA